MKTLFTTALALLVSAGLASFIHPPGVFTTIEGIVTDSAGNQAIKNAYVYTISGEEEAVTDERGFFSFKTWQSLPVTCTITHKDFKQQTVRITGSQKITVRLSRK